MVRVAAAELSAGRALNPQDSRRLDKALKEQEKSGGELSKILIKLNLINEDVLAQILSEGLGLPPINVSRLKVDPEVLKIIP